MRKMVHSLSTQVALVISSVLCILILVAGLLIDRQLTRAIEDQEIDRLNQHVSMLLSTLTTLMLNGNGTLAKEWLDSLHGTSGVLETEVLDSKGQVAFRDTKTLNQVNKYLGQEYFKREPEPLHFALNWVSPQGIQKGLSGEAVYEYSEDQRVVSVLMPIPQQDDCLECHGYDSNSIRGIFMISVSTEDARARITAMRNALWALAVILIALLGTSLWGVLRVAVLRPIASLRDGIMRVSGGDRSKALSIERSDELGEVARLFNDMQEALALSEARIRAVMDNVADGIIITDESGKIESVNPAVAKLFDYASHELLGKNLNILISSIREDEYADIIENFYRSMEQRVEFSCEIIGLRENGEKFPLEIKMSEMSVSGKRYVVAMLRDITHQKEETAALQYRAMHDPLTGIPNRSLFFDRLEQTVSLSQRKSTPFALIIMDLDRFKIINDNEGHHVGDEVLMQVSQRVLSLLRKSDTVARLGGDEFAILLPGMDASHATQLASKILQSMNAPFEVEDKVFNVGASLGIALFPTHGERHSILMRHADTAMYYAKRTGLGFVLYTNEQEQG